MFWQCNIAIRFGIAFLVNEWLDKRLMWIGPDDDEKTAKRMFVYWVCLACHGRSFDAILMPFHKQTEKCLQNIIRFEFAFLVTEWLEKRSVCTGPDYDEKKTPAKRMFVYWVCSACHGQSFHSIPKLLKRKKIDILTIKYSNQIWNCILVYRTIREKVGMYGPADKRKNKQKQTNRKKTTK